MNANSHSQTQPPAGNAYQPLRPARPFEVPLRGMVMHGLAWGEPADVCAERPALLLGHGFMDVAASFQFFVDALAELEGAQRYVLAPDWRGFGRSVDDARDHIPFIEHLADLDALLRDSTLLPLPACTHVDMLGHSMGANIMTLLAAVRPERIRRLVNIEGFGLPATDPSDAPAHIARWLEALVSPARLRSYANADAVAARLKANNPRMSDAHAAWLAPHWAQPRADGQWHIRANPAHKRPGAHPFQEDEWLACWRAVRAPVLWVQGADTEIAHWWGERFGMDQLAQRLDALADLQRITLADCGHMVHHDQPQALAQAVQRFLAVGSQAQTAGA